MMTARPTALRAPSPDRICTGTAVTTYLEDRNWRAGKTRAKRLRVRNHRGVYVDLPDQFACAYSESAEPTAEAIGDLICEALGDGVPGTRWPGLVVCAQSLARTRGGRQPWQQHLCCINPRPPTTVDRSGMALKAIPRRRVRFGPAQSRRCPGPSPTRRAFAEVVEACVELWATCLGATNAVIGEDAVRRRRTIR